MTLGRLRLSVADARDLAEGALRGIGYHHDEARIIADHVIDAAMQAYAKISLRTLAIASPVRLPLFAPQGHFRTVAKT